MRKNIFEIIFIYLVCLIYAYFYFLAPLDKWLLPVLWMLYFGSICSVIYILTYKIIKSPLLFFAISWLAAVVLILFDLKGAKSISLTRIQHGNQIYEHGNITSLGVLYELADPIGFMAIISTILLIRNKFFTGGLK